MAKKNARQFPSGGLAAIFSRLHSTQEKPIARSAVNEKAAAPSATASFLKMAAGLR
jgi:hypothetical protein